MNTSTEGFFQIDNFGEETVISSPTPELRSGLRVRVLIPPTTTRRDALNTLLRIQRIIGEYFEDGPFGGHDNGEIPNELEPN